MNLEQEKITANKVAQFLDISVVTLNNWYKWYNSKDCCEREKIPCLPMYTQAGPRAPRYWTGDDLYYLKKFQEWIPKGRGGVMGEYNARYWGERGQRALKNKSLKNTK